MTIKPSADTGAGLNWSKSSYSTNDGPECVEVAAAKGTVLIRDSKKSHGPQLAFPTTAWSAFVAFAVDTR